MLVRGRGSPRLLLPLQCEETEATEHILIIAFQDAVHPCGQISSELQTLTSDLTVSPTWSGNKSMLQTALSVQTMSAFKPTLVCCDVAEPFLFLALHHAYSINPEQ